MKKKLKKIRPNPQTKNLSIFVSFGIDATIRTGREI